MKRRCENFPQCQRYIRRGLGPYLGTSKIRPSIAGYINVNSVALVIEPPPLLVINNVMKAGSCGSDISKLVATGKTMMRTKGA